MGRRGSALTNRCEIVEEQTAQKAWQSGKLGLRRVPIKKLLMSIRFAGFSSGFCSFLQECHRVPSVWQTSFGAETKSLCDKVLHQPKDCQRLPSGTLPPFLARRSTRRPPRL